MHSVRWDRIIPYLPRILDGVFILENIYGAGKIQICFTWSFATRIGPSFRVLVSALAEHLRYES